MSQSNSAMRFTVGVMLWAMASCAWAQEGVPQAAGPTDKFLFDVNTLPTLNDPHEVELLFKEGNTILSILEGLNEKGFHIDYKEKQFAPAMTLLSLPTASKVDDVIREIVEPWGFQVNRTPMGKLVVRPEKKSKAQVELEAQAKR